MVEWTFHYQDILHGLPLLVRGLGYTVLISVVSFVAAMGLGSLLGLLREESRGLPAWLATSYIELLRGIPLILFLVFIHYGLMPALFGGSDFLTSSLLAFILFESAYIGEIIRSGLKSVTPAEREAAKSLGLSYTQQLRLVILPLTYSRMTPTLIGQFISLIKDTSLASIVGVIELTRAGEIIYEQTFHDFEILSFQATVYFVLCYSLSRFSRRFEVQGAQRQEARLDSLTHGTS